MTDGVSGEIRAEQRRQREKFGQQDHPDGTGGHQYRHEANRAQELCQRHADNGEVTFALILREEVYEALAEGAPARLRAELVQVAATCATWIDAIDRREGMAPSDA